MNEASLPAREREWKAASPTSQIRHSSEAEEVAEAEREDSHDESGGHEVDAAGRRPDRHGVVPCWSG